ncbi:hypothetical protein TIFTF001_002732 [Ficus carica]|uniref:Uncharacterized protein n=1 Tax=Ficus carica TaxID=3494 RepID=A0AA87ZW02_FICCA|nr:hypothetical protein TIFTF001_002732 [Ficus carica]
MFLYLSYARQTVENVRSGRNPSVQIEDNMVDSYDDDSDLAEF